MRTRLAATGLAFLFLLVTPQISAASLLQLNEQLKLQRLDEHNVPILEYYSVAGFGTGGPFRADSLTPPPDPFLTFCMELLEGLNIDTTLVVHGFREPSGRSAFLYIQFLENKDDPTSPYHDRATWWPSLQLAIWHFEGYHNEPLDATFIATFLPFGDVEANYAAYKPLARIVILKDLAGLTHQDIIERVPPVPEPTTALLLVGGLAAAAYRRRRSGPRA